MPKKSSITSLFGFLTLGAFVLLCAQSYSQESDSIPDVKVSLRAQKSTIYNLLNQISDSTGYYFAYDSRQIQSESKRRIKIENMRLKNAIFYILNDTSYSLKCIDKHILIYRNANQNKFQKDSIRQNSTNRYQGRILDFQTGEPLVNATIKIKNQSIGTIANREGSFLLSIPDSIAENTLEISYLGYKTKLVDKNLFLNQSNDIYLEIQEVSIPEIIIRSVEPNVLIQQAIEKIPENYSQNPICMETFYREGVKIQNRYQYYIESFFKVYKAPYNSILRADAVKEVKMRKIVNRNLSDTIFAKLQGGIHSSLRLDIVKSFPNFFDSKASDYYDFTRANIVIENSKLLYEIQFVQKPKVLEPLYCGSLYIDIETLSVVKARFEINPQYVEKASSFFISKRRLGDKIKAKKIAYFVDYEQLNGRYYLSHVRGEMSFQYRRRGAFFLKSLEIFFEMATTHINTVNIINFDKSEVVAPKTILYDKPMVYDREFWSGFTTIPPEEDIKNAIKMLKNKLIEER